MELTRQSRGCSIKDWKRLNLWKEEKHCALKGSTVRYKYNHLMKDGKRVNIQTRNTIIKDIKHNKI